ncbi:MAG: iron-containing alcohol dehydrogenase [Thermodesulfobacteriota bacterium]|nr:iron-containing alcohol dehydrogenase [Thermodesulfobacteriota bacterium]
MAQVKLDYEAPAHLKREFVFQTAGILPPNGILFGFNTIHKVGEQAKKLGGTQAILVTDEIMLQLGYVDLVKSALEKEGLQVEVFGKVDPEPHMETADALYDMVRKTKFDLVVGLGGGSAMDMAKLTSIVATNEQTPFELMSKKVVAKPALKKILIPTTSGTGSEVSMFFVASAGKDKYFMGSPYAYPEISIIDPGLTISMPPKITASTGIDALSHAIESLMNKLANPLYDSLGLGGVELVSKYLRRATFNGQDLEARYYMSMGSTISMISMTGTGGLYSHSISYVLAQFQPLSHGIGCGVSLPYTMAFNLPVIEDKLALIARAMGERTESLSPRKAAQRAVEMVYDLIADVKMPVSLKEMGFQHEDVYKMAEICITKYPRVNNPRSMSKEECLALFEAMWEGKLSRL